MPTEHSPHCPSGLHVFSRCQPHSKTPPQTTSRHGLPSGADTSSSTTTQSLSRRYIHTCQLKYMCLDTCTCGWTYVHNNCSVYARIIKKYFISLFRKSSIFCFVDFCCDQLIATSQEIDTSELVRCGRLSGSYFYSQKCAGYRS